jgi:NADH dehydrogenase FAD-containing subunit
VWSTGNKASPLNETLESLQRDKKKSFVVTEELQVLNRPTVEGRRGEVVPDVWAMGDCAQIDGHPLPATAQVSRRLLGNTVIAC